jgi:hypothetical protein
VFASFSVLTIYCQALKSFILSHRETFLMFLREKTQYLFIGSVEVLQLLIVILHRIGSNVSEAERASVASSW